MPDLPNPASKEVSRWVSWPQAPVVSGSCGNQTSDDTAQARIAVGWTGRGTSYLAFSLPTLPLAESYHLLCLGRNNPLYSSSQQNIEVAHSIPTKVFLEVLYQVILAFLRHFVSFLF